MRFALRNRDGDLLGHADLAIGVAPAILMQALQHTDVVMAEAVETAQDEEPIAAAPQPAPKRKGKR